MTEFLQANFIALMCGVVGSTVVWAVVSSLIPQRKQKLQLDVKLDESAELPARRAIAARG